MTLSAGQMRRRICIGLSTVMVVAACFSAVVHHGRESSSVGLSEAGKAEARRAAMGIKAMKVSLAEEEPRVEGGAEMKKEGEGGKVEGHGKEGGEEGEGKRGHMTKEEEEEERAREEDEEEMMENAIKARWGFAFVTIIIIFSVAFVKGSEAVREAVPEELEEVVSALMEELTTLGFLGFAFFITTMDLGGGESLIEQASMYALNEPEALKELFEGLHYLVFFISLSFIFGTVGGLFNFQVGAGGNKAWEEYEKAGPDVAEGKYPELFEIAREHINASGSLANDWRKPEEARKAEYLRVRSYFISTSEEPRLDPDFDFHKYLQRRVGEIFSSLIEVGWKDWLVTWLLLLLFWSVVQEGMIMEKLLLLYLIFMLMIMSFCILLQSKMVWIQAQLLPRNSSEMRASYKNAQVSKIGGQNFKGSPESSTPRVRVSLAPPVYMDQTMVENTSSKKGFEMLEVYFDQLMEFIRVKKRPSNKHERLFWLGSWGPEVMLHMIRLAMLWVIISLALLLSHHLPGIITLGAAISGGHRWFGYILFGLVVVWHIFAMLNVYTTARIYTVCTSIEMLRDKEAIEKIVREQKYEKCSKAIEMLFTLNYYLEQAQQLEKASSLDRASSGVAVFVAETPEEQKALDDLTELFQAFDEDGSGELSAEEVKALLQTMGTNLPDDELHKLIRVMDADGSGEISLDELASVMLNKKKLNGQKTKLSEVGKQLFDMFDKEGDGTINVEEMVDCFGKMGKNWDMAEVRLFFDLIDTDGSGEVDRVEFMDFCTELESMRK